MERKGISLVSVTLQELLELKNEAKQFSLSVLKVKSNEAGPYRGSLMARGMEFEESRRYLPGDDVRNIDWRVTARTAKAHTKLFAEEKAKQMSLCMDLCSSMFFATRGVYKAVQASLMAAKLSWSAALSGDQVGGLIFDEAGCFESRPACGKRGVLPILHAIAERMKMDSNRKKLSSLPRMAIVDQAMERLKKQAVHGSLVVILSDFRYFSPYALSLLKQIAIKSDLCLFFIYDLFEAHFPKNGLYPVTDGNFHVQLNGYDRKNLERYQKQFMERKKSIADLALQPHLHFMECSTEENSLNFLKKLFSSKK